MRKPISRQSRHPVTLAEVRVLPLRPAASSKAFDLHRIALEWSLAQPIVIHDADDVQSRASWEGRVEPYEHQMQNLFTFCRRLPVALVADDVGLGKTISAGLILSELMIRRRVKRALVLCPSILGPQWVEELEGKFGIDATFGVGTDLDDLIKKDGCPVVVTTYESARSRIEGIPPDTFDFLVLDEAHKLRNLYGSSSPPRGPTAIRQSLESRLFRYVLMLTATPIQNRLWDVYSLVDCLTVAKGHKNPFGTPQKFRQRFVADAQTGRQLVHGRSEEFRAILRQYLVRTRRQDAVLTFPDRGVQTIPLAITDAEAQLFEIVSDVVQGLNALAQSSVLQALVSSPDAVAKQLENMAERGTISAQAAREARRLVDLRIPCAKLKGLRQVVVQLVEQRPEDWRLLIFTSRKETVRLIARWFDERDIDYGIIQGGDPVGRQDAIVGFREDPPRYHVVISTDSGAEGVNLQSGNVLVNFDLPWNPMVVEQRIGRIQRLGSKHARVEVVNLILQNSYEEHIVAILMEKLQVIAHTIGDIEALLEASGLDRDGSGTFESQIREMVLKSLQGQDMRRAARIHAKSIEEARNLLETQRDELDQTLGRLDDLHRLGPRMPKLETIQPSLPAEEFVRQALADMGGALRPLGSGLWELGAPGEPPRRIAFDESSIRQEQDRGVFMGSAPMLFQPGSRDFERLTQHWCENYAADVVIPPAPDDRDFEDVARSYCASIDDAVLDTYFATAHSGFFEGLAICRARVGNGVDSYETLIDIPVAGSLSDQDAHKSMASRLKSDVDPAQVFPDLADQVAEAVKANEGVALFFDHYLTRLQEELTRAGKDSSREKRLRQDLDPVAFAEVVGLRGESQIRMQLDVIFTLDDEYQYEVQVDLGSDHRSIASEPARSLCELSQRLVPESCLGKCTVTGKKALEHLLESSDVSGLPAFPDELVECEETEAMLLPRERARCQATGKLVNKELLEQSSVSTAQALPSHMERCSVTGKSALSDELVTCLLTGSRVHPDLVETCSVSGAKALRDQMVQSDVTSQFLLPQHVQRSDFSGRICSDQEVKKCAWSGRLALPDELRSCELTKLLIGSDYFDSRHTALLPLASLLDDPKAGLEDRELARALRKSEPRLARMATVYVKDSGERLTACCGRSSGILGINVRWFAFTVDSDNASIVGSVAECARKRNRPWTLVARL